MPELFGTTDDQDNQFFCVDREDVRDDIRRRRQWDASSLSKVAVYTGPGGIGKSTIRKAIESELLIPGMIPYAIVDYELDSSLRSCEKTFCSIRRQLGRFGLRFPTFDLIWARHWEETTQQRVTKNNFPTELSDAAEVVAIVPLLGSLPTALVALGRLSRSAAHWVSVRFSKTGPDQLLKMNAGDLQRAMPEAIARDLEEMMEEKRYRGQDGTSRITVIFDAYERLEENGVDDWFVREFCRQAGSVLKVVFGRRMLDWEASHPLWGQFIEHHPALPNLEPSYAAEYLMYRSVDNADLRRYLIELTDGFPYYLDLAADLCHKVEKEAGREPAMQDFLALEQSSNLGEALLRRLLRELPDYEYGAVLVASVPRWFNKAILEHLLADPASVPKVYDTLIRYSFCENVPSIKNAFTIRKEARRLLRSQAQDMSHWIEWNTKLRDYHAQRHSEILHLAEEIYHSLLLDSTTGLDLFHQHFYDALANWRFSDCWTLLQAQPPIQELSTSVSYWLSIARISLLLESWESGEHLTTAKNAIEGLLKEAMPPEVHARGLHLAAVINVRLGDRFQAHDQLTQAIVSYADSNDSTMQARAFKDLGDIHFALGNSTDALANYQKSLKLLGGKSKTPGRMTKQAGAAPLILNVSKDVVLQSIAGLYGRTGHIHLAVKALEARLAEGRKTGNIRIIAETLSELGLVYRRLGQLEKAHDAYTECLPLFEQLRLVSARAHVFCGLGMTVEQAGDDEGATSLFQKAEDLFEQAGEVYGQAKIAHCMARVIHRTSNYSHAKDLYEKSLRLYRQVKSYAFTGSVLSDLAKLKLDQGDARAAAHLCNEAISIFGGLDDAIGVAAVRINLGICLYKQDHRKEALVIWREARPTYKKLLRHSKSGQPQSTGDELKIDLTTVESLWVGFGSLYDPYRHRVTLTGLEKVISDIETELASAYPGKVV
jgi:tetratricopeptide (TPR) repeat protein